jgi:hypothetical protein
LEITPLTYYRRRKRKQMTFLVRQRSKWEKMWNKWRIFISKLSFQWQSKVSRIDTKWLAKKITRWIHSIYSKELIKCLDFTMETALVSFAIIVDSKSLKTFFTLGVTKRATGTSVKLASIKSVLLVLMATKLLYHRKLIKRAVYARDTYQL